MPVGHIGINVSDLEISYSYYRTLMPYLAYEPFLAEDDQFAFQPANNKRVRSSSSIQAKMDTALTLWDCSILLLCCPAPLPHLFGVTLSVDEATGVAGAVNTPPWIRDCSPAARMSEAQNIRLPHYKYASFGVTPTGSRLTAVCHK